MYTKYLLTIVAALAAHSSASCMHGTALLKRQELPGGRVATSNFGYTGLEGPLNWASLAEENVACHSGKQQSPINIDDTISLATEAPKIVIDAVQSAEFENLGTTVEVIVNGTTTFAGADFSLRQFHFHTPSEHRIAEEYFPLEMHMVHEAADGSGGIVVIAVPFQLSDDGTTTTALLTSVTEKLGEIIEPGTVTETGALDFAELIDHLQTTPLFQYTGSLTTPPCAEGLTFLVAKEPLPLSVKTFNAMKAVIKFNSRYTQNAPGLSNLLEVSATVLGCELGEGVEEVVAPKPPAVIATTAVEGEHPVETEVVETTTTAAVHETTTAVVEEAVVTTGVEHVVVDTTTAAVHETTTAAVHETTTAVIEEAVVTTTSVEHVVVETPPPAEHPVTLTTTVTKEAEVETPAPEHPEPVLVEKPVVVEEPAAEHPEPVVVEKPVDKPEVVEEEKPAVETPVHPPAAEETVIEEEVVEEEEAPAEHPPVVVIVPPKKDEKEEKPGRGPAEKEEKPGRGPPAGRGPYADEEEEEEEKPGRGPPEKEDKPGRGPPEKEEKPGRGPPAGRGPHDEYEAEEHVEEEENPELEEEPAAEEKPELEEEPAAEEKPKKKICILGTCFTIEANGRLVRSARH